MRQGASGNRLISAQPHFQPSGTRALAESARPSARGSRVPEARSMPVGPGRPSHKLELLWQGQRLKEGSPCEAAVKAEEENDLQVS